METKQLLKRLDDGEKLDSAILRDLADNGYINVSDTTNHQTPVGVREYLFISLTEKGKRVLTG